MSASSTSVLQTAKPHLHIAEDHCPLCEQPIPHEEFERIVAKARERDAEITARLQEQFAQQKTQDDAKAKADLERFKTEGETALGKLREESLAREATARDEGKVAAETALKANLSEAETAKAAAEQASVSLKADLEKALKDSAAAIEQERQQAVAKEHAAREEGKIAAEAAMKEELARAEASTVEAVQRLGEQRESLEKASLKTLQEERAGWFGEKQKLEEKVQDVQRQLQSKTSDKLGEGAELDLFELLKEVFPGDKITRFAKGEPRGRHAPRSLS